MKLTYSEYHWLMSNGHVLMSLPTWQYMRDCLRSLINQILKGSPGTRYMLDYYLTQILPKDGILKPSFLKVLWHNGYPSSDCVQGGRYFSSSKGSRFFANSMKGFPLFFGLNMLSTSIAPAIVTFCLHKRHIIDINHSTFN